VEKLMGRAIVWKTALALAAALALLRPALAQGDDAPRADPMPINAVVDETLTDAAFYDWWLIQVAAGETLIVEMRAGPTLAPLLGVLDPSGTLVARSADGVPGGTVTLEYTAAAAGEHIVVATRVGNRDGDTSGTYQLSVRRPGDLPASESLYQQVTFRCDAMEIANAVTLEFAEDPQQYAGYVISVYGLDAFVPVIRIALENVNVTDCARNPDGMDGDVLTLPGMEPLTITGPLLEQAAQLSIIGSTYPGPVTLTVGSLNSAPGRFVVVVQGFHIDPASDNDALLVGQGPLAARRPLALYMIADKTSRLDPALRLSADTDPARALACDDAGSRRCRDLPSAEGLRAAVSTGGAEVVGGRFDAGLLLRSGAPELLAAELSSFQGSTSGGYALVLLGELPARDAP